MKRYAIVILSRPGDKIDRYLPDNYAILHEEPATLDDPHARDYWRHVVIGGTDFAGWTLDDYVIPRLGSGLYPAREIDLSHPIMKRVPNSVPVP